MDQKEIDELLKKGNVDNFNKKQEELYNKLSNKINQTGSNKQEIEKNKKKGKVLGQLSKVTEEAEAGTNMVMNFLDNVLTITSKMKEKLNAQKDNEENKLIDEMLDSTELIENLIFNAMDAFQFQDINRQKLMKVMYTLAKLNEYLNDLLGADNDEDQTFGHDIENTSLFQKDGKKSDVDSVIEEFKKTNKNNND